MKNVFLDLRTFDTFRSSDRMQCLTFEVKAMEQQEFPQKLAGKIVHELKIYVFSQT